MPATEALMLATLRRRLDQSRLYDWAMRIPIVAYSLFVLLRDVSAFLDQRLADHALSAYPDGGFVIATLTRSSQWMFVLLLAILPVFRLRPLAKSDRLLPRLVALLAVCVLPMFMMLTRAPANLAFNSIGVVLGIAANAMAVVTVSFLGRSLSIMPEARQLVQSGPYAVVRHPLYLCEIVGVVAVAMQYRSFAAMALFAVIVALQIARARWEEMVLVRAFPDFAAYRTRTPFMLPRDPVHFLTASFSDARARRRSIFILCSTVGLPILALAIFPLFAGS